VAPNLKNTLRILPALVLAVFATPVFAGGGVGLATYRAIHDLILDPSKDAPDLSTMQGRLVTEFSGSACAGYTTTTRFVTAIEDGEGERQVTDSRSKTFESADGRFDFDNKTYDDGEVSETAVGSAQRKPDGVTVKLTEPGKKTLTLAAEIVFPTAQIVKIIAKAREGKHFASFSAYDGLESGDTVQLTTTVIGPGTTDVGDIGKETAIIKAGYGGVLHWPVTISYFNEGKGADEAPIYAMSAILYENGIMRQLRLNYGKFTLIGTLVQLDVLPEKACP
jgi:hypothetical protein